VTSASRVAKGVRPVFNSTEVDRLLAIIMAVASEVSALRERIDTIERLAEGKGVFAVSEVESYRPDELAAAERDVWRTQYIDRVLAVIRQELDELEGT
jgi:hypothetical protein